MNRQHGTTTAEFQRGFDSGEQGDVPEWFDWDGYAALAAEAQKTDGTRTWRRKLIEAAA